LADQEQLARVAAKSSIGDFTKHLKRRAAALQSEADAQAKLVRQRRATRLRYWVDDVDDMWRLAGAFDPLTGSQLQRLLDSQVDTLAAAGVAEDAPDDPRERLDHHRARALADLVGCVAGSRGSAHGVDQHGAGSSRGRSIRSMPGNPIVVVDATTAIAAPGDAIDATGEDGRTDVEADPGVSVGGGGVIGPIVDWGVPVELPPSLLLDVFGVSDPDVVVVANGVILHAPGRLDLGRTTRLANRAQRRALRGMYATCAIPGCAVHYDRCKLHHVVWWRHGGRTDLENLLPVCQHHHTRLHDEEWQLTLGPNRELTIVFPDGTMRSTGPPRRSAA
ncbi:MAG: HNH endonuclease, partial [Actinomycetota bacterium]